MESDRVEGFHNPLMKIENGGWAVYDKQKACPKSITEASSLH